MPRRPSVFVFLLVCAPLVEGAARVEVCGSSNGGSSWRAMVSDASGTPTAVSAPLTLTTSLGSPVIGGRDSTLLVGWGTQVVMWQWDDVGSLITTAHCGDLPGEVLCVDSGPSSDEVLLYLKAGESTMSFGWLDMNTCVLDKEEQEETMLLGGSVRPCVAVWGGGDLWLTYATASEIVMRNTTGGSRTVSIPPMSNQPSFFSVGPNASVCVVGVGSYYAFSPQAPVLLPLPQVPRDPIAFTSSLRPVELLRRPGAPLHIPGYVGYSFPSGCGEGGEGGDGLVRYVEATAPGSDPPFRTPEFWDKGGDDDDDDNDEEKRDRNGIPLWLVWFFGLAACTAVMLHFARRRLTTMRQRGEYIAQDVPPATDYTPFPHSGPVYVLPGHPPAAPVVGVPAGGAPGMVHPPPLAPYSPPVVPHGH